MKKISCGWLKRQQRQASRQQKGNIVEMRWISLLFSQECRFIFNWEKEKSILCFQRMRESERHSEVSKVF